MPQRRSTGRGRSSLRPPISDNPSPVALLSHKRDGGEHSPAHIEALIAQFMDGRLADYQMSAWLMAAYLRGLSPAEMTSLTHAMQGSGNTLELRSVRRPKVDKHSTGGVGDKISLCLGPLVAACGAAVPMIAGRGLGHTGGTLDKLEAIAGYQVRLSESRFEKVVREVGVAIIGQTDALAPADRRIYALRDVTATVASIPLIVASILSKKLAEGIDALVLDVKVGRGAFMEDKKSARKLAQALVSVGQRSGKKVRALLTDMDAPLGLTIGNALELREAIEVLHDRGPADIRELTLRLGEEMLVATGLHTRPSSARAELVQALRKGHAYEHFERMVHMQGGDVRFVSEPHRLPEAEVRLDVVAQRAGYVTAIDARVLGELAVSLGAGRKRAEDVIDPAVGIELCVERGAKVKVGQRLAVLHLRKKTPRSSREAWRKLAESAFCVRSRAAEITPLVLARLTSKSEK